MPFNNNFYSFMNRTRTIEDTEKLYTAEMIGNVKFAEAN